MPHVPLRLREATRADRDAVLSLFAAAFRADEPREEWTWKYDRNPHPAASAVAIDETGRAVGFYGAWGTRYRGAGGDVPGASGADMAVRPGAGGLGKGALFRALGVLAAERNRAAGVPFLFGFPSEKARRVGEGLLDYVPVERAGQLRRVAEAVTRRRFLRRAAVGETFGRAHAPLAEALHARPGWRTDRSAATLNWRFAGRPGVTYETVEIRDLAGRSRGYAALRFAGERALLVDLQARDEASGDLADVLDEASRHASSRASHLEVRAPRTGTLHARLRDELGFGETPADCFFETRAIAAGVDAGAEGLRFDYRFADHDVF